MKILFLLLTLISFGFAENQTDTKEAVAQQSVIEEVEEEIGLVEPVLIEDTSGLSHDEVREKAAASDEKHKSEKKVSITKVVENTDQTGKVDISKIQQPWEELSPQPVKYDWIQTKSGEWFKGKIKAMYKDKLEFDSNEIGLYTFDFDKIKQIKSYHIIDINIENVASIPGIIRYKDDKIKIIQGEDTYTFDKKQIVAIAPTGEEELNYWSGKVTLAVDIRAGNKTQFDYTAKVNIRRRSVTSKLVFDYLGRVSSSNSVETANDHRLNEKYDVYLTRYFFWTPIFTEYYQDKFQNIEAQYTGGVGVGYTLYETADLDWDISGGPALIHTKYITVTPEEDKSPTSFALELSTRLEYEISNITDIEYQYKLTVTDKKSGSYKHHMVLTFSNELLDWLDLDISGIWDYTKVPEVAADLSQPLKNDYQLLVGLGIEF